MSHEITKNDHIAYAASGGLPWHRLGTPVADDLAPADMLKAAKLDWPVELRELSAPGCGKISDHKALVRKGMNGEKDIFLDVVGDRFKPVQNEEMLEAFSAFIKAGGMTMETAGSLREGRFVWALAKTKEGFKLAGGDEVHAYFLIMSPHKQGWSFTAKLTPTRVVCWNTLSYSLSMEGLTGTWKMRHSRSFDDIAKAEMAEALGLAHKTMDEYKEKAEVLSKKKFTDAQTALYLTKVFEPDVALQLLEKKEMPKNFDSIMKIEVIHGRSPLKRVTKALIENPETASPGFSLASSRGTAWGAFNIVTHAYDHLLGRTEENRAYKGTMGSNARRKLRALDLALDMSGIKKAA